MSIFLLKSSIINKYKYLKFVLSKHQQQRIKRLKFKGCNLEKTVFNKDIKERTLNFCSLFYSANHVGIINNCKIMMNLTCPDNIFSLHHLLNYKYLESLFLEIFELYNQLNTLKCINLVTCIKNPEFIGENLIKSGNFNFNYKIKYLNDEKESNKEHSKFEVYSFSYLNMVKIYFKDNHYQRLLSISLDQVYLEFYLTIQNDKSTLHCFSDILTAINYRAS